MSQIAEGGEGSRCVTGWKYKQESSAGFSIPLPISLSLYIFKNQIWSCVTKFIFLVRYDPCPAKPRSTASRYIQLRYFFEISSLNQVCWDQGSAPITIGAQSGRGPESTGLPGVRSLALSLFPLVGMWSFYYVNSGRESRSRGLKVFVLNRNLNRASM